MSAIPTIPAQKPSPKRYVFLLLPGFSHLSFTCALEALSLANYSARDRDYYSWKLVSDGGGPVTGWNGVTVQVDGDLDDLTRHDTLIVCSGLDVGKAASKRVLSWLRRETRKGMDYGAMNSGAYVLALAGLVDNKQVTVHWEYQAALTELLPNVQMMDTIYTVDGRVFTCAGGASSMDMILHRIAQEYGRELSTWVAEQMVYTAPRTHSQSQRMSMQGRAGVRHVKLAAAVEIMRDNIEDPLTPGDVADQVELSTRQLERLFGKYLSTSPKKYYLMLRLEKSRHLLLQTELSLTDIGVVCGFKSQSHFSKSYRAHFGIKPSHETGASRSKG